MASLGYNSLLKYVISLRGDFSYTGSGPEVGCMKIETDTQTLSQRVLAISVSV